MSNDEGKPENEDLGDLNLGDEDTDQPTVKSPLNRVTILAIVLCLLAAAGSWFFFVLKNKPSTPPVVSTPAPTPLPTRELAYTPTAAPSVIEEQQPTPAPTPTPLPTLTESDAPLTSALVGAQGLPELTSFLAPEEILRKFVRAVYNVSKGNVVPQYRPINGPNSIFKAQAIGRMALIPDPKNPGESLQTAIFKNPPKNQKRYTPYVTLLKKTDDRQIAQLYTTYYPLLQKAYEELGEGPQGFHSVMLTALDTLLATPNPQDEPELILTSVQYQYLDPQLEALSNAQKLLLRMGNDNRTTVLSRLSDLRKTLTQVHVEK